MKIRISLISLSIGLIFTSCNSAVEAGPKGNELSATEQIPGQSGVQDENFAPNIVQVASGSKDHTTLVAAVKAADLADILSNAGPFTVFGPTNAAFDKLPAGTLERLLKPENETELANILEYHTYVGVLKTEYMQDGQSFEQVNGGKIKISKKGDKIMINDKATIVTSIPTSNGIIHVIDEVLLPQ
jgi:uncharacterized surface protein with fasciclin (FAS1) repeats